MIPLCSYVGLQEVSFPVALMSKSCKLIVVMVGGVLLLGKKYQMRDYLAASAIVAGLFIFQQDSAKSGSSTLFGISVLLLSLTFDSLNSNYNEKVVSVNRCNRLRLQCLSIAASCMCRCDVLRVFSQTNFVACIMSAVCVIVSGVQSPQLHVHSLKRASAGELYPSLVAFAEQPMCLALLVLMNIFLCVPVPTAPFVTKSTAECNNLLFPEHFPRYFAVLQWSYFLKEFGATAAVGVGIGRKYYPEITILIFVAKSHLFEGFWLSCCLLPSISSKCECVTSWDFSFSSRTLLVRIASV
jgi:hypothetical protein